MILILMLGCKKTTQVTPDPPLQTTHFDPKIYTKKIAGTRNWVGITKYGRFFPKFDTVYDFADTINLFNKNDSTLVATAYLNYGLNSEYHLSNFDTLKKTIKYEMAGYYPNLYQTIQYYYEKDSITFETGFVYYSDYYWEYYLHTK